MTTRRKVLIAAAALALVLGATIALVLTNIDWVVKNAIERYGSRATGTSVQVAAVRIRLSSGSGTVEGLTVANPGGFSSSPMLALGSISIRLEPRSVASDVVNIDEIRVKNPQILYEIDDSRRSNIDALRKNMGTTEAAGEEHTQAGRPAKRIRIRTLVIENGGVNARIAAIGGQWTAALRRIELHDIGGRSGASPENAARQIIGAILDEALREVTAKAVGTRQIEKQLERAFRRR